MKVTGSTGATGGVTPNNPMGELGQEQFLQLLVAQISHQNPLEPMDDKDLIAQLAQFSGVEQSVQMNRRLTSLQNLMASQERTGLSSLIGKHVTAESQALALQHDEPADIVCTLPPNTAHARVRIMDGQGRVVRTLEADLGAGAQTVRWDGKGNAGEVMPEGYYHTEVQATDDKNHPLAVDPKVQGTVTGLSFKDGKTTILVGSVQIRPQDVVQIDGAAAPEKLP